MAREAARVTEGRLVSGVVTEREVVAMGMVAVATVPAMVAEIAAVVAFAGIHQGR